MLECVRPCAVSNEPATFITEREQEGLWGQASAHTHGTLDASDVPPRIHSQQSKNIGGTSAKTRTEAPGEVWGEGGSGVGGSPRECPL